MKVPSIQSRFGIGFRVIIHLYNTLFIISNTLLNVPMTLIALLGYRFLALQSFEKSSQNQALIRGAVIVSVLSIIGSDF